MGNVIDKKKMEALFSIACICSISGIIMDIVKKAFSDDSIKIDLSKYYLSDKRYHWKEMIEQLICEQIETLN